MLADQADHVLGVDTHRDSHSAAALTADTAVVQGQITVAANERGYRRLPALGAGERPRAPRMGSRGNRQLRRRPTRRDRAKSDELDAIRAAREALTHEHLAQPRQRGEREALRVLLATRHSAVRSKRAAITLMKGLLVSAAPSLREGLRALGTRDQLARCARLRVNPAQSSEQRATIIAIRASRAEHSRSQRKRWSSNARSNRSSPASHPRYSPRWASERSSQHRSSAPTPTPGGFAPRPRSQHSVVSRHSQPHPGRPSGIASAAQATASSTERYTRSCSAGCAMTPKPAPTQPAAKPKAAAPERSSAASSATPPDTSTASSTTHTKNPQIAKLDKHRSIGDAPMAPGSRNGGLRVLTESYWR
jgi:hypothetical protein